MNISIYWARFMERFEIDYNSLFPKLFRAEFQKNGKKYRVEVRCWEHTE